MPAKLIRLFGHLPTQRLARLLTLAAACAFAPGLAADAQTALAPALPFVAPIFTDHMVLQRGTADPIWGWTSPGSKVTAIATGSPSPSAKQASQSVTGFAGSDGRYMLKLPGLPVGGPYTLVVTSTSNPASPGQPQTVTFNDVLSGDVWVCTGQSNMQYGIGNVDNADAEIADAANYPQIRFFYVPKSSAATPAQLVQGGPWDVCSPSAAKADGSWNGVTAVGYFFCRDVYKAERVPIGLLSTSVGGTPAEAWTSVDALQKTMPDIVAGIPAQTAAEQGKPADYPDIPGTLFNTMINPLIPFGVKGYVWYQGESNVGRGYAYRTLLPTLIGDWRDRWMEGDTPFLIVQLAGWQDAPADHLADPGDNGSAEVRDAQWQTAQYVKNAHMATAVDIGDPENIHPKNKQETGRRLALVAEREVYGDKSVQEDSGPIFKSLKISGSQAAVSFDNADGGLTVSDGKPIAGFEIAGDDHKWAWANAALNGSTVVLTATSIPKPVAVRYAWSGWLPLNLYGKSSGLPVYPFRTDNWKLQSQP